MGFVFSVAYWLGVIARLAVVFSPFFFLKISGKNIESAWLWFFAPVAWAWMTCLVLFWPELKKAAASRGPVDDDKGWSDAGITQKDYEPGGFMYVDPTGDDPRALRALSRDHDAP